MSAKLKYCYDDSAMINVYRCSSCEGYVYDYNGTYKYCPYCGVAVEYQEQFEE